MGDAYIELIENFFSTELRAGFDADGLRALDGMSVDQLELFRSHWEIVDRSRHEQMVQSAPAEILEKGTHPGDAEMINSAKPFVSPTSALFTHPYNGLKPIDLDLVKRQALLFSRIALIAPQPNYYADPKQGIASFAAHATAMLEIKDLVKDGTVELIPMCGFYSNEIEGGAGLVRRACEEVPALQQWIASQKSSLDDFSKSARKGDPFFDAGIRICSSLTYGHTLAATHPFVGGLYKQLLSDAPRVDRSKVAATQHIELIDLPGFSDLTWADIKAVRDNEDSLATWRADLDVAITSVDPDLPPEKFLERFDSQVQAQLARAALNLDRDIKSSAAMARFKKGASALAISAVAATAKCVVFGPAILWQEVTNVFRKDGPKEAIRFMWERKEQKSRHALRRHYAVFSSKER